MKRKRNLLLVFAAITVFASSASISFANEPGYLTNEAAITKVSASVISADGKSAIKGTIDSKKNIKDMRSLIRSSLHESKTLARISAQKKWIPIYTVSGIKYAYFVPLYKKSSAKICGYSVVVSINDSNRELVAAIGIDSAKYAEKILKVAKVKENKLLFEFPEMFLIKRGKSYYCIPETGKNKKMDGSIVRNLHDANIARYLSEVHQSISAFGVTDYGHLKNWEYKKFVPITDVIVNKTTKKKESVIYYGGHQNWLQEQGVSKTWADKSCGVTAASNMMYYLSKSNSKKTTLYTQKGITKKEFSKYQKDVYPYLNPAIWGIPGISTMAAKIKDFAKAKSISLTDVRSSASWNEANVRNYVCAGLKSECPVLLITWNSSKIPDLNTHWVTVTRLYNDGKSTKMVTSNWNSLKIYDFSTWVKLGSLYAGVLYFK